MRRQRHGRRARRRRLTTQGAAPARRCHRGMFDIDEALRYLIVNEGSDLHLKVPAPPIVRVHGKMTPIEGAERLTPEDTERVLRQILTDPAKLDEFDTEKDRKSVV